MTTPELRPVSATRTTISERDHLTFTCTFCWRNYSTSPRVVGSSARLACEACYNALLSLSICWVCGEVVVRGDDCVSLGWCFWHKSCYGCLLCGNRMVAHGATVKEVFADGDVDDGVVGAVGQAKEIDEIPLCAHCYVEVGAEEMDSPTVVSEALGQVDSRDGGLSRKRYDDGRRATGNAEPEWISGMGDEEKRSAPMDSTIYVSIRDPTGPAFKPSPTKPIPSWMAGTPAQDHRTTDYGLQVEPTSDDFLRLPSPAEQSLRMLSSYTPSSDRTAMPNTPEPEPGRPATPQDATPRSAAARVLTPETSPVFSPRVLRYSRAGVINSESLKRPSSRLNRIREESRKVEPRTPSPYKTPPEWPNSMYSDTLSSEGSESQEAALYDAEAHHKSPEASLFSETSPQSLSSDISPTQTPIQARQAQLSISPEPSSLPQHTRLPRKSTMLRAKIAAAADPPASPSAIPMSSEFLERYGLVKGREQSRPWALLKKPPTPSRRSSRQQPPHQAIMARVTKNSRSAATTGRVDETTVVTGTTDHSATPKQFSLDSTTGSIALHDGPVAEDTEQAGRRGSLQAELWRLFRR